MRTLLVLALFSIAACGGDDDSQPEADAADTADTADAAGEADAAAAANALGRACDADRPCPTDPPHSCVYLASGNPEVGYCSPSCTTDDDCVAGGYDGPTTGMIQCFVPDQPNTCSITCESAADCPGDTVCVAPGGPAMICASE